MNNPDWYVIENVDEMDTPSLVIYKNRVNQNIRTIKNLLPNVDMLRPHVKTNKSARVVQLMLDEGIKKFKCATIIEAEMLGNILATDVLLSYQPVGPTQKRFVSIIQRYPKTHFSCLIDNLEIAKQLSQLAIDKRVQIDTYIDINLGMNRTGILPGLPTVELYKECLKLKGINIIGLHGYDGHINGADFLKRKVQCDIAFASLEETKELLYANSGIKLNIVVGGSPTFSIHNKRVDVECSPGTFVFWDKGYHDNLPEQNLFYAALVVSRVISLPNESTICIDLGYKAIASEMPLEKRALFLNAPSLQIKSHSEEHMTLRVSVGHSYKIGDVLYAVPYHICPTVSLYDQMAVVIENRVEEHWDVTARKRI